MRKQSRGLRPVSRYPLHVLSTAEVPLIRHQRRTLDKARVGDRRLRVREIAEVNRTESKSFHRTARDQVINVTANAEWAENRPGSAGCHHVRYLGAHLGRQSRVARRDPAPPGVEAKGRIGCPAIAGCSRGRVPDPADAPAARHRTARRRPGAGTRTLPRNQRPGSRPRIGVRGSLISGSPSHSIAPI